MTVSRIPKDLIPKIRALPMLRDTDAPRPDFLRWSDPDAKLACYYAPFEYLNKEAKLILVGITPGGTQMNRALNAARNALATNTPIDKAIRQVKREGSFSGSMRPNIVATLNRLGYERRLGLSCSSHLWSSSDHLVQFCSLLKYPVFVNGKDYNGSPHPLRNKMLERMVLEHFVPDMQALPHNAMLVPLGDTVLETIVTLRKRKLIPQQIMLFEGRPIAPPHPSGANAESIALLLETRYPARSDYEDRMYRDYLTREPWKKKGGKPQPESKYKAARAARWESTLLVRRAYGIPDVAYQRNAPDARKSGARW